MNPEEGVDTTTKNEEIVDDFAIETDVEDIVVDDDETVVEPTDQEDKEKLQRTLDKANKKYDKSVNRIKDLEKQLAAHRQKPDVELTDEEKKEKQAEDFIRKKALEAYEEAERNKTEAAQALADQLQEEFDTALDEYPEYTESQLKQVISDYATKGIAVRPAQAAALLKEGYQKATKKEKPKIPDSKRATGKLEMTKKEDEATKNMSFDEKMSYIARTALSRLNS